MTIHSDWAKVVKQRYPQCFSQSLPKGTPPPQCGIIDGHIQLMGAYHVTTWDHFLNNQFARPINQLFAHGCKVVVLLFDNRLAVSPYKGMTQYKRCKRYQDVQFSKTDQLPQQIPTPWIDHMMNRNFKDKVISFVCERIQALIKPDAGRTLIVDFKGPPKIYTSPHTCPSDIPGLTELGESDIKFVRYVHMLGNSLVYATDGDYIPISLLYYSIHGLRPDNHIIIYRQEANVRGRPVGTSTLPQKRTSTGKTKQTPDAPPEPAAKPAKTGKRMEFVTLQPIYFALLDIMHLPHTAPPSAITAIVAMMLLAGTDYSRGLPLVGPRRMVEMGPSLTGSILDCIETSADGIACPRPTKLTAQLVHRIYAIAFATYLRHSPRELPDLLTKLQASSLADRTKGLLPSLSQIDTTTRNVAWVVHYWKDCINTSPDLTQPSMYGFKYDTRNRQFAWADTLQDDTPDHPDTETSMLQMMDPTVQLTVDTETQIQQLETAQAFIRQQALLPLQQPQTEDHALVHQLDP